MPETGSTRLISRNRIITAGLPRGARPFYMLFMEPGSLVMERKTLLGIKTRAERLARDRVAIAWIPGPSGPGRSGTAPWKRCWCHYGAVGS